MPLVPTNRLKMIARPVKAPTIQHCPEHIDCCAPAAIPGSGVRRGRPIGKVRAPEMNHAGRPGLGPHRRRVTRQSDRTGPSHVVAAVRSENLVPARCVAAGHPDRVLVRLGTRRW